MVSEGFALRPIRTITFTQSRGNNLFTAPCWLCHERMLA